MSVVMGGSEIRRRFSRGNEGLTSTLKIKTSANEAMVSASE
jgi:hypothetical protein